MIHLGGWYPSFLSLRHVLETSKYSASFKSVSCIDLTLFGGAEDAGGVSWPSGPRRPPNATIISVIHSIVVAVAISVAVAVAVWLSRYPVIV